MATLAGDVSVRGLGWASLLYGAGWEARRAAYARGWMRPERVASRVVSVGNLTVGGTGKTTLALHLAARARARGLRAAVVCRDYRPGPAGLGDEALLYRDRLGADTVFSGTNKRACARRAAAAGAAIVFVDDGFSHWRLERDVDVVLLDRRDLWGGARLLPAGRMREPRRALQRAQAIVLSRLGPGEDPAPWLEEAHAFAPAALMAAGRHRASGVRTLDGSAHAARGPARVVTATGNPSAVVDTAREAGFAPVELSAWRDHHWFSAAEAARELGAAAAAGATLVLTAKDAVRWPRAAADPRVVVLEVEWEWVAGGEALEALVFDRAPADA